ncbi:hypothetical protein VPH209E381_0029 [Vibrio phage 209E38-1]
MRCEVVCCFHLHLSWTNAWRADGQLLELL